MNEYEIKVTFLDEDGYKLESQIMTSSANSKDEACEIIEDEIENGATLYPSDNYEFDLIDVH